MKLEKKKYHIGPNQQEYTFVNLIHTPNKQNSTKQNPNYISYSNKIQDK